MQKACGIIAISAIALSASQFASAQTQDQSSRLAGQSSALRALREEVKNTLRDAGFTNIRIMSESFLVRAIDQNGNPVVMVVHPDAQAIMPEASEDQDEANDRDPAIRIRLPTFPKMRTRRLRRSRAGVSANRRS